MTCSQCKRHALPELKCFVLCSASGKWPLAETPLYHQPGQSHETGAILCLFAEAELSLGGLLCVCVLVCRKSPVSQAGRLSTWTPAETNQLCPKDEFKVSIVLRAAPHFGLIELSYSIDYFRCLLEFSVIVDLIKHDCQHYEMLPLWFLSLLKTLQYKQHFDFLYKTLNM